MSDQKIMRLLRIEPTNEDISEPPIWLKNYEPSTPDGRGLIEVTADRSQALRGTTAELLTLWKAQSTTMPLRPDGEPNRPLTCCSVQIEDA